MTSMELVGLNTKWYRYQNNLTQEQNGIDIKIILHKNNMLTKLNLKWHI